MDDTNQAQQKKGWADKLKDWAFEAEESKNTSKTQPSRPTPSPFIGNTQAPVTSTGIVQPTVAMNVGIGMVNPEKELRAMEHFMKLLDKANLPGPDFFEFYHALRENIKTMGGAIPEDKLYLMVFNSLKGMGLESNILISSSEQYVSLLKEHFDKFANENQRISNDTVGSRQKKIETLNTAIQQKVEQIKKLQDEIAAHNTDIGIVQGEIQTETTNIEETRVAMESAYNKIHNEFSQVGAKCKAYIPQ